MVMTKGVSDSKHVYKAGRLPSTSSSATFVSKGKLYVHNKLPPTQNTRPNRDHVSQ